MILVQGVQVCVFCLFSRIHHSVLLFEFVCGPLCFLWPMKPQSSCLWFWSGVRRTRQQFALWVCVLERTSLKRVRVMQQGAQRPPTGKKPSSTKNTFTVNHIRSHTQAESKHVMEKENNDLIFFFCSWTSPKILVIAFVFILFCDSSTWH